MRPRLESAIPVLPVRDVSRAVAFYEGRLGFRPLFEYGPYAGVARGPIEIHLDGGAPDPAPVTARFAVSGVDAIHAELEKQGVVHPDEPLETKPFGMRQFSALDADGNRLTFAEPADREAQAASAPRRFLITFTHVDGAADGLSRDEAERMVEAHRQWVRDIDALERSSLVYLAPKGEARTVRRGEDGRLEASDGPVFPGPEAPGGFMIVEAESLEDAVGVARRYRWLPGSNEVREIRTPPGLEAWIRS